MTVILTLPFPISVNAMFITGKYRRARSQRYEDWVLEAGYALNKQKPPQIKGPVTLAYEVQDGSDGRRRDLGNLEKCSTDLLVSHKVIEADDNTIVREINLRWCRNVSGVRVTITPVAA